VRVDQGYRGEEVHDVLGPEFRAMHQAHMVTANGFGIELFQLLDPPHERRERSLEYWKNGFFHICVTDPNIEELASRIASSGGRQRSKVRRIDSTTNIGSAIAKIHLATSSRFIPTTTRPYTAAGSWARRKQSSLVRLHLADVVGFSADLENVFAV
jgi:hypothetical protein